MTDTQLDEIESALGLTLPGEYRRVSREFPFRPVGNDYVYWFHDDPARVIGSTRAPLCDGEYDKSGWRDTYVVIGESAAGDLYLLDTANASPVYCLSHETHQIEVEWPTFAAFVEEWRRFPEEYARERERQRAEQVAWWRRWWIVMAVIVIFAIVLPALVLILAPGR